jgi:hypothetical protein
VFQLTQHEILHIEMENRLNFVNESPCDLLYVCEEKSNIVGVLGFRIRENIGEFSKYTLSLLILENNRKGIDRYLMNYAEPLAKEHRCVGN